MQWESMNGMEQHEWHGITMQWESMNGMEHIFLPHEEKSKIFHEQLRNSDKDQMN